MSVVGLAPGSSGFFIATPFDVNGKRTKIVGGFVPAWITTDVDTAPVVPSSDGFSASVKVPYEYRMGSDGFALTVSLTLRDHGGSPTKVVTGWAWVPYSAEVVEPMPEYEDAAEDSTEEPIRFVVDQVADLASFRPHVPNAR